MDSHSKNHVDDNIPKQFHAAFAKFWTDDERLAILRHGDDKDMEQRMKNFRKDMIAVEDINNNPNLSYSAAINKISTMNDAERNAMLNTNMDEIPLQEVATRGELESKQNFK